LGQALASIREREGRFYGRYRDEHGRKVERRLSAMGVRAARLEAHELEAHARRIRRGLEVTSIPVTVRETWEKYRILAKHKASWDTIRGRFENHLLPHFGAWHLHSISPADVERFLAVKSDEGLSPQTCAHLRVHLAALYTFARRREKSFRGENPALLAERPDIPEKPPRFLEAAYVVAVINAVPARWRSFFALAVYTGLRAGELRGLRLDSVDTKRRILSVWRSNKRDTTKGKKLRIVPIPSEAMPYLAEQLREARSEWLFPSVSGAQLPTSSGLPELLRSALVRVGLLQGYQHRCLTRGQRKGCGVSERRATNERTPCPQCGRLLWVTPVPLALTFRSLRTTYGTHAYEATGDIRYVQRVLGHGDVRTTERIYAGLRAEHMVSQADRLKFSPSAPTDADKEVTAVRVSEDAPTVPEDKPAD
jgi:integrase